LFAKNGELSRRDGNDNINEKRYRRQPEDEHSSAEDLDRANEWARKLRRRDANFCKSAITEHCGKEKLLDALR